MTAEALHVSRCTIYNYLNELGNGSPRLGDAELTRRAPPRTPVTSGNVWACLQQRSRGVLPLRREPRTP
jgi:hypothetical protein